MSLVSIVKTRLPSPHPQTEINVQQSLYNAREDVWINDWAAIMRPVCRKLSDVSSLRPGISLNI